MSAASSQHVLLSPAELAYLQEQRLARLTTIGPDGAPQVRPVAFAVDPVTGAIDIAGREQLGNLTKAEFNKVGLFAASGSGDTQLTVVTSEDGSLSQKITLAGLEEAITAILSAGDTDISEGNLSTADIDDAITEVAKLRAQNGGETSNLNFALNVLSINRTNLEAANSRIIDVDVAEESTRLARYNILVQAGTAMLAQANASSQLALRLLQ